MPNPPTTSVANRTAADERRRPPAEGTSGTPVVEAQTSSSAVPTATVRSDAELLRKFVKERDPSAFGEIVSRYERLVMGVALRQVGDRHRAEDVFQATFLVLAERAARIRKPEALAAWLHGTARRIGLQALSDIRLTDMSNHTAEPAIEKPVLEELQAAYERQALDAEIDHLPEKYRLPLVLHYLDGLTGREVADRLGLSVDAVEGRLKQGRNRLRERLLRHGVGLGVLWAAFQATQSTAVASTAPLVNATITASLAWVNHQSLQACSANAARLAGKELAAMSTAKTLTLLSCAAALCLGTGVIGAISFADGIGGSSHRPGTQVSTVAAEAGSTTTALVSAAENAPADAPVYKIYVPPGSSSADIEIGLATGLGEKTTYSGFSPAREQLEQTLEQSYRDHNGAPEVLDQPGTLAAKVEQLRQSLGVPIRFDRARMEEMGLDPESLELGAIVTSPQGTVRNVLEQLLDDQDLACIIQHDVLTITTAEYANEVTELVVYEARDLESLIPSDQLREMILAETGDDHTSPWMETHGTGDGSISSLPGALVIRQTQRGHREVANLLKQLREFAARPDLPQPQRSSDRPASSPGFLSPATAPPLNVEGDSAR